MANLFTSDWNREAIGYPVHIHCWLLLDRVIGHDIAKQNLRVFVKTIEAFWKRNEKLWDSRLPHCPYEEGFYEMLLTGPLLEEVNAHYARADKPMSRHDPGSPLRIPEIEQLIEQVTREPASDACTRELSRSTIVDVPLEVALGCRQVLGAWAEGERKQGVS